MTAPNEVPENIDDLPEEVQPNFLIRRPGVLFTKGYLNNPIRFAPESELFDNIPEANIVEGEPDPYQRDVANFLVIQVNSIDPRVQHKNISCLSPRYSREKYEEVFDTEFVEIS